MRTSLTYMLFSFFIIHLLTPQLSTAETIEIAFPPVFHYESATAPQQSFIRFLICIFALAIAPTFCVNHLLKNPNCATFTPRN